MSERSEANKVGSEARLTKYKSTYKYNKNKENGGEATGRAKWGL